MVTTPATTTDSTPAEEAVFDAIQALVINQGVTETDAKKAKYLAMRYMAFPVKRAAELAEIGTNQVKTWKKNDQVFAEAEAQVTGPKRKELQKEIVGAVFQRNLYLLYLSDAEILAKIQEEGGVDNLTPSEFKQFESLRKSYSAEQWKSILNADNKETTTFNIQTIVDRRSITSAASPSLPSGADGQSDSGASVQAGPATNGAIEGELVKEDGN